MSRTHPHLLTRRHLPRLDHRSYYDAIHWMPGGDSDALDGSANPIENQTNLGNKDLLEARYMRHGKLAAWSPMLEEDRNDRHTRKRLNICLEEFMPAAAADVDATVPVNITNNIAKRPDRKKIAKKRDDQLILPHLRSPSPPRTTEELAPMLSVPQTYLDIMTSSSMRYTLGDDTVEQGLQRTASELLDCEKPLLQSLGRLRDMLRFRNSRLEENAGTDRIAHHAPKVPDDERLPALPHLHDTDNLWRVQQELLQVANPPTLNYSASDPTKTPDEPPGTDTPTVVQRLFIVPSGITLSAIPSDAADKTPVKQYNINLPQQITAVDDALERVSELLADCNEYKERLEEVRNRIANIARARKKVWAVLKDRAGVELDRLEEKDGAKSLAPRLL